MQYTVYLESLLRYLSYPMSGDTTEPQIAKEDIHEAIPLGRLRRGKIQTVMAGLVG
jgi:hypothetical protein